MILKNHQLAPRLEARATWFEVEKTIQAKEPARPFFLLIFLTFEEKKTLSKFRFCLVLSFQSNTFQSNESETKKRAQWQKAAD